MNNNSGVSAYLSRFLYYTLDKSTIMVPVASDEKGLTCLEYDYPSGDIKSSDRHLHPDALFASGRAIVKKEDLESVPQSSGLKKLLAERQDTLYPIKCNEEHLV